MTLDEKIADVFRDFVWSGINLDDAVNQVISVVADDLEKTTVKIPFESEGYLAGAKDEHAGIVEYLKGLLDN